VSEKTLAQEWHDALRQYAGVVANYSPGNQDAVQAVTRRMLKVTRALIVRALELSTTGSDVELWHKTARALLPDRTDA
jgi:hypothetical protein